MKKILTIIVALIAAMFLAACGGGSDNTVDGNTNPEGVTDNNAVDGNTNPEGVTDNNVTDNNATDNNATDNNASSANVISAVEMLVGIDLQPGEKAMLVNGQMQKTTEECPGDETGVWQSGFERHFDYEINPNTGEHMIALCSDSPFKIKISQNASQIYDDYTIFVLTDSKKTIHIYKAGIEESDGKMGFIGGNLGLAWSQADDNTTDMYGNGYIVNRVRDGNVTVFRSYDSDNGVLETESNSTVGMGVTSFKMFW